MKIISCAFIIIYWRNSFCPGSQKKKKRVAGIFKDSWGIINAWVYLVFHQYCLNTLQHFFYIASSLEEWKSSSPHDGKHLSVEASLGKTVNYLQPLWVPFLSLTLTFDLLCSHAIVEIHLWPQNYMNIRCKSMSQMNCTSMDLWIFLLDETLLVG